MRRARDRELVLHDENGKTDRTTDRAGETTANDDESRAFGDSDDALDVPYAETLVDMKRTTSACARARAFEKKTQRRRSRANATTTTSTTDVYDDVHEGTRYCSSCKQHLPNERFLGVHRKTCAACLRWHKLYQRRKRRSRKKRD